MIKAVFFDVDNTLVNHTQAEKDAFESMRKTFFANEDVDGFKSIWIEKTKKYWILYEQKKLTFQQQRIKRIQDVWKEYGIKLTPKKAESLFTVYLQFYEQNWQTFPHAIEVLASLKKLGLLIGIITNGNYNQQQKKLQQLKLNRFFKKKLVIVSEEAGFAKPDPRIFKLAQKISKSQPNEILYFGDNIKVDIETPLALGWNAIVADHFNMFPKTSFQRITSFLEIPPLLK